MMIVFGGCTNSGYQDSRNDLYALNLDTFEWKKLSGSGKVPSPRHGHSMTMIGDSKVALFGGAIEQVGRDGKPMITRYNDLYVYDIQTNEWSVGEAGGSPPNPRVFHSAALIEKRLWIFGGECDISQTDLTILDIGNSFDIS
jgi:N-acetylneuraminic acid mutarotase